MFPSCRNQWIDLQCKLIHWFLHDGNISFKSFNLCTSGGDTIPHTSCKKSKNELPILLKNSLDAASWFNLWHFCALHEMDWYHCSHYMKTNQLIYILNQFTGFHMMETVILIHFVSIVCFYTPWKRFHKIIEREQWHKIQKQ